MYELCVKLDFDAAHRLVNYKGKCENLHGHNWKIEIYVKCENLNDEGMAMDFHDIKSITKEKVIDKLDHKYINEIEPFDKINPTSENLAKYIFDTLFSEFEKYNVVLSKIVVWETEGSCASYWA